MCCLAGELGRVAVALAHISKHCSGVFPCPSKLLWLLLAPGMPQGSSGVSSAAGSQQKAQILERQVFFPSLQPQGLQIKVWTHKSKVNIAVFACWSRDHGGLNPATVPRHLEEAVAEQRHKSWHPWFSAGHFPWPDPALGELLCLPAAMPPARRCSSIPFLDAAWRLSSFPHCCKAGRIYSRDCSISERLP